MTDKEKKARANEIASHTLDMVAELRRGKGLAWLLERLDARADAMAGEVLDNDALDPAAREILRQRRLEILDIKRIVDEEERAAKAALGIA